MQILKYLNVNKVFFLLLDNKRENLLDNEVCFEFQKN